MQRTKSSRANRRPLFCVLGSSAESCEKGVKLSHVNPKNTVSTVGSLSSARSMLSQSRPKIGLSIVYTVARRTMVFSVDRPRTSGWRSAATYASKAVRSAMGYSVAEHRRHSRSKRMTSRAVHDGMLILSQLFLISGSV